MSAASCRTVPELVRARASERPEGFAFEIDGRSLGYAEADRLSDRVAAGLARIGVGKGDRVASFAFNCVEQILVWFGAAKLGAVWVPVNVGLLGEDLAYTLNDSGAKVLVADVETDAKVDAVAASLAPALQRYAIGAAAPERSFAALLHDAAPPEVELSPADPAVIIYTGGTTGLPKGVVLPQYAWIAAAIRYCEAFEVGPGDRHYSVLSLFHVGGLMIGFLGPYLAGIPTHIDRWFSASRFWPRARETGATIIDPIGTMVTLLCQRPPGPEDRDHQVRASLGVLSQVPEDIARMFMTRFGFRVVNVYSLSETGGTLIVHNTLDSPRPFANGRPGRWCELRIVDDEDNPVPVGTIGEITMRPTVAHTFMLRYHNNPERTIECFRNLWLHTGDLGRIDEDGYLHFTGRQAHWLRSRGENISAYEVENILSQHPAIRESIVVGVPAALGEEDVKVFIIPVEGRTIDPAELVEWCAARMAPFKVPRFIEFAQDFPRSVTKREVERHKLKAMSNDAAWDAEKVLGRRSIRSSGRKAS